MTNYQFISQIKKRMLTGGLYVTRTNVWYWTVEFFIFHACLPTRTTLMLHFSILIPFVFTLLEFVFKFVHLNNFTGLSKNHISLHHILICPSKASLHTLLVNVFINIHVALHSHLWNGAYWQHFITRFIIKNSTHIMALHSIFHIRVRVLLQC